MIMRQFIGYSISSTGRRQSRSLYRSKHDQVHYRKVICYMVVQKSKATTELLINRIKTCQMRLSFHIKVSKKNDIIRLLVLRYYIFVTRSAAIWVLKCRPFRAPFFHQLPQNSMNLLLD